MSAQRAELALRPQPRSALLARSFVTAVLRGWKVVPECVETAVLLVSEIVTNAIRHARTAMRLVVDYAAGQLRCSVQDGDPTPPRSITQGDGGRVLDDADPDGAGGRGLMIVAALADRWGVDPVPAGGKSVWFSLAVGAATG